MNQFLYPMSTVGTVNFLEDLAVGQNSAINVLPGLPRVNSRRYLIRAVSVVSVQNLGLQFLFFSTPDAAPTELVATDSFVSSFGLVAGMAVRYDAAGLYRYYMDGLAVPYYMDGSGNQVAAPSLNVALGIQGATAKLADAAGALRATFWVEPMSAVMG